MPFWKAGDLCKVGPRWRKWAGEGWPWGLYHTLKLPLSSPPGVIYAPTATAALCASPPCWTDYTLSNSDNSFFKLFPIRYPIKAIEVANNPHKTWLATMLTQWFGEFNFQRMNIIKWLFHITVQVGMNAKKKKNGNKQYLKANTNRHKSH